MRASSAREDRTLRALPWIAAGATLLFHLVANPHYGFFRDELYFIMCGFRPDWGYVDQPPLVPLLAALTQLGRPSLLLLRAVPALRALKRYVEQRLERAGKVGGDGLIAELVRLQKDGARLSRDEMVATVSLLLLAGSETTAHLISGSVLELAKNPALRDWLVQDWSQTDLGIEEFLRFICPVQVTQPRVARRDADAARRWLRDEGWPRLDAWLASRPRRRSGRRGTPTDTACRRTAPARARERQTARLA